MNHPHPDDIPAEDDDGYCPICDGAGACCPIGRCTLCALWYDTDTTRDGWQNSKIVMDAWASHIRECGLCQGQGVLEPSEN